MGGNVDEPNQFEELRIRELKRDSSYWILKYVPVPLLQLPTLNPELLNSLISSVYNHGHLPDYPLYQA
jgi:hypothetical protein